MKRFARQSLCFIILLLIYSVLRFPYSGYGNKMLGELERTLRGRGVMLDIPEATVEFPGVLVARNISLVVPVQRTRIPFFVDRITLSPSFLSLLMLSLSFDGDLELYGGTVHGSMEKGIFGDTISFTLRGRQINMASHQIVQRLGVSGLLNVELHGELTQTENVSVYELGELVLSADLSEGEYTGRYRVAGMVEIPTIRDVRITAKSRAKKNKIQLESLELFSSMGSLNLSGAGLLSKQFMLDKGNTDIRLELTPEGQKAFGSYLALAAGVSLDSVARQWSIQVGKKSGVRQPDVLVRPAG